MRIGSNLDLLGTGEPETHNRERQLCADAGYRLANERLAGNLGATRKPDLFAITP